MTPLVVAILIGNDTQSFASSAPHWPHNPDFIRQLKMGQVWVFEEHLNSPDKNKICFGIFTQVWDM